MKELSCYAIKHQHARKGGWEMSVPLFHPHAFRKCGWGYHVFLFPHTRRKFLLVSEIVWAGPLYFEGDIPSVIKGHF